MAEIGMVVSVTFFVAHIFHLLLFSGSFHQSQCNCSSEESRKSTGMLRGVSGPAEPGGMVRSSHSMLSRPVSGRPMLSEEGGDESQKLSSDVSMGEHGCCCSISWACSSSIRPRVRGSGSGDVLASVPSRKASSWLSGASEERLGRLWSVRGFRVAGGATWICGGGLDRTVLTGRVVILAVTGRVLLRDREGSCWTKGVISGKEGHLETREVCL